MKKSGKKFRIRKHLHLKSSKSKKAKEKPGETAKLPLNNLIDASLEPVKKLKDEKRRKREEKARAKAKRLQSIMQAARHTWEQPTSPREKPSPPAPSVAAEPEQLPSAKREAESQELLQIEEEEEDQYTRHIFGPNTLTAEEVSWLYKRVIACVMLPLAEGHGRQDSIKQQIMESGYVALQIAFRLDRYLHQQAIQHALPINHNLLNEMTSFLMELEECPFFSLADFENNESFKLWKERERGTIQRTLTEIMELPEYAGNIVVKIVKARNLCGEGNKIQPYCKVILQKTDKEATQVSNGCNPVWGQEFSFWTSKQPEVLEISVWDKSPLVDQCMGKIEIRIDQLQDQVPIEKWFELLPPEGNKAFVKRQIEGELRVCIHHIYISRPLFEPSTDVQPEATGAKRPPDANSNKKFPLHYEAYQTLLAKLIKAENRGIGVTLEMEQPLSEQARWMLEEFAARYHVPTFFTRLSYLGILCKVFMVRKWFLLELVRTLQLLIQTKKSDHEWNLVTAKEKEKFEILLKKVNKKLKECIAQYQRKLSTLVVEGDSKASSSIIIQVLPMLMDLIYLTHETIDGEIISGWIEWDLPTNSDEEERDKNVSDILTRVIYTLDQDKTYYQRPFIEVLKVDVIKLGLQLYIDPIRSLITDWLKSHKRPLKLTQHTFAVYFGLCDVFCLISPYQSLKEEQQKIGKLLGLFAPYVDIYLDLCKEKLQKCTMAAFKSDKWQALNDDDDDDDDDQHRVLHSGSVVDIFVAYRQAMQFLFRINLNIQSALVQFIKMLGGLVDLYINSLEKSIIRDSLSTSPKKTLLSADKHASSGGEDNKKSKHLSLMQKANKISKTLARTSKHSSFDSSDVHLPVTITKEVCVRVNNIETAINQLSNMQADALAKVTSNTEREEIEMVFQQIRQSVKMRYDQIIIIITSQMNPSISKIITFMLENLPETKFREVLEDRVERFYAYLNTEMEIVSNQMYYDSFIAFLSQIWMLTIRSFEEILLPANKEADKYRSNRPTIANVIGILLNLLFDFFEGSGDGLQKEFLEKSTAFIRVVISLYQQPTSSLMQTYERIEAQLQATEGVAKDGDEQTLEERHIIIILQSRKKDKNVKEFLKAKKKATTKYKKRILQNYFKLPQTEELIEEFACANELRIKGRLYVTTSFICFRAILDSQKVIIQIKTITSLKKDKHYLFSDSIQIISGKEEHTYWDFNGSNDEKCYVLIMQLARQQACLQQGDDDDDSLPTPVPLSPSLSSKGSKTKSTKGHQPSQSPRITKDAAQSYNCICRLEKDTFECEILLHPECFILRSHDKTEHKIALVDLISLTKKQKAKMPKGIHLYTSSHEYFCYLITQNGQSKGKTKEAFHQMKELWDQVEHKEKQV